LGSLYIYGKAKDRNLITCTDCFVSVPTFPIQYATVTELSITIMGGGLFLLTPLLSYRFNCPSKSRSELSSNMHNCIYIYIYVYIYTYIYIYIFHIYKALSMILSNSCSPCQEAFLPMSYGIALC